MIIDAEDVANRSLSSETLIIGAGAVGITLALKLARAGRRVTLLEEGNENPPADYRTRNEGPNTGRLHQGMGQGRMHALGGTTRLWGGQLVPFGRVDLDQVTFHNKRIWPLRHREILPYYSGVLELLGISR